MKKECKWWFKILKKIMKIRYKRPRFVYLGEEIEGGSIVLCNHEGTDAPMSLEIYLNKPIRMWGAHEMNSGLIKLYKYQTIVYFHEKKGWNLHLARLFCLIASPLTNLFYKGLNLISTYKDVRFVKTIRESVNVLKNGESLVIYPEDSKNGYLKELEGFFAGFAMVADVCKKEGMDVPIYVAYFRKEEKMFVVDAPIKYSELSKGEQDRKEISKRLCQRCNELGKLDINN